VPTPMAGDMERGGTLGGGPDSAPGDRRCELRDRFILFSPSTPCSVAVFSFRLPNQITMCEVSDRGKRSERNYFEGWARNDAVRRR
jgi:hypothetical protein